MCACVHTRVEMYTQVQVLTEPRDIRFPWTYRCLWPFQHASWELNSGPAQEQYVLLITELHPQPCSFDFNSSKI